MGFARASRPAYIIVHSCGGLCIGSKRFPLCARALQRMGRGELYSPVFSAARGNTMAPAAFSKYKCVPLNALGSVVFMVLGTLDIINLFGFMIVHT